MKLVDANVRLYAVDANAVHHHRAREWLDSALNDDEPLGFSWVVLLAFLRISTRSRLLARPLSPEQAFGCVELWLSAEASVVLEPTSGHLGTLRRLLKPLGTAGNLTSDAHLAALALEHDAVIVSYDNDFDRFEGIRRLKL